MSSVEDDTSILGDLVIVGASAGGVEALSILVGSLPASFPAPIVLAQHLDPARPSSLNVILQRCTSLPVEVVNDSSPLVSGTIYVVPSNRHVSINDHRVEVHEDRSRRPRPSVDTLFTTAAEAYGERLIAVVLTGSGSDGAIGAVDVKNAGGTVIVQDPQSARYPSMPLSLPPTIIDFEVPVEQMGSLIYDLLNGVIIPQTEEKTEDILQEILGQVSHQANVDFRPYKTSTILRRIGRRMAITRCRTMRDYANYLKDYPEEVGELVKAFLINVTQFFRDADAYAYIKNEILPQLIAQARERDHILRFWTAGCATGEEPYSLAMLITDILGAEMPEWSIKIFATDLDDAAITFARRGLYSENLLKGVPVEYREHFFEHVEQGYRISKTLRQMVIFGQQDLSRSAPFPRIDLVFCRNVLIYFTPELQDYVLNQFAFSLSPTGYLFLGKAETVRPAQTFYELVNKHWKVYRCIDNALPSIRHQAISMMSATHLEGRSMHRPGKKIGRTGSDQELLSPGFEIGHLKSFNDLLLRFLPIGVIVIDRFYHILTLNGAARRLLGLHDVTSEQDFLHAVRGIPYQIMRTAIDNVFRNHNALMLAEVELEAANGGIGRFISISIGLMQIDINMSELAALSITDVTEQVQARRQLEAVQIEQTHLVHELSATNKRLSDVNKELMDANEELQVGNEELVLTHEELQASIEEFETTNEELQATNEELETNNEEFQATNEELETTNDELRARTSEMQELTSIVESERVCLSEMVELAPFYILVLRGVSLIVEAYNPNYVHLLERRIVQGRLLEEIVDLFWEGEIGSRLVLLAREVYRRDETRTIQRILTYAPEDLSNSADQVPADQAQLVKRYFTYTLVPSHDANKAVNGVIVYASDETHQHSLDIQKEFEHLTSVFKHIPSALLGLYDAQSALLLIGTPDYLDILTRSREKYALIGHRWHENNFAASGEKAEHFWNRTLETLEPVRIPEVAYQPVDSPFEKIWDYTLTPIMNQQNSKMVRFILVSAVEITEQGRS